MRFLAFFKKKLPINTTLIETAISHLERHSSAEVRVVVEKKMQQPLAERVNQLFDELHMQNTVQKNGVLIYLSFKPHYVAIKGDENIHNYVGEDFWQAVYLIMQSHCQAGNYTQAICEAIHLVEVMLTRYFPIQPDDINELPNEVIIK